MLDHEDGQSGIGQLPQQEAELLGFGVVKARRRLVQKQHTGTNGEGTTQLDETGPTGRELPGADLGVLGETQSIEDQIHLVRRRELGPLGSQELRARRCGSTPALSDLAADLHVLANRHRAEHLDALERPTDTEASALVRAEARDVSAVEDHLTRRRRQHSTDHVEGRGLASTIGTDQPSDGACLDGEVNLRHCEVAAEPDGEAASLEKGHQEPPAIERARSDSCSPSIRSASITSLLVIGRSTPRRSGDGSTGASLGRAP